MNDLSRAVGLFGHSEQPGKLNLDIDVWKLEEAVALTLGIDVWKLEDVVELAGLAAQSLPVYLSLNQAFLERCQRLKRAAIADSLPSAERGGNIWFKPHDFLTWYDAKSGWKDDFLPAAMEAMLKEWRANARTASNADNAADKPLPGPKVGGMGAGERNAAASQAPRGVAETWELMRSEMSRPLGKRKFKKMEALKDHCENEFGIRHHDFEKLRSKAIRTPGLTPWPKGRPKKTT